MHIRDQQLSRVPSFITFQAYFLRQDLSELRTYQLARLVEHNKHQ